MVKIAIDIMGGDHAPNEILEGAMLAIAENQDLELILVGSEEAMPSVLPERVTTHFSQSVMAMDESVENLRGKRDSSIWQATALVKNGEADAIVSAGSTGAQMASALMQLKRITGIDRPAVAVLFPTKAGHKVLMDTGANTSVTARNLKEFAEMGKVYASCVLGIKNPRIALLSNGTEEHKGTELVKEANALLKTTDLNFIGNLEGRDVPYGNYDVMVTDGFSGNITIKVAEGVSAMLMDVIKENFMSNLRSKIGAMLVKPAMKDVKSMLDYRETGGAPLLGVNGVSIVCHGGSDRIAVKNAIKVAKTCVNGNFIGQIADTISEDAKLNQE